MENYFYWGDSSIILAWIKISIKNIKFLFRIELFQFIKMLIGTCGIMSILLKIKLKLLLDLIQLGHHACFISDLYERSIDDVLLFNQRDIINYINTGDSS